jgi:hypothetical protein
VPESYTGQFLRPLLQRRTQPAAKKRAVAA